VDLALGSTPFDSLQTLMARAPARRTSPSSGFGPRLAQLRQARGLTQEELGALIGLYNRMFAYYERDDAEPPGAQLAPLATALRVTTDELLGPAPITETHAAPPRASLSGCGGSKSSPTPSDAPCSRWSMSSSSIGARCLPQRA
jgi:transcriptional regulator with XRE-family HTH domain